MNTSVWRCTEAASVRVMTLMTKLEGNPRNFGRIAGTAKQVVMQRLREEERKIIMISIRLMKMRSLLVKFPVKTNAYLC